MRPGQLLHARGAEVADGAQEILLEPAQEERPVAALEADLVIVDDHGVHHALSPARGCLGRRRYTVLGTSTLGGLRGIGLRTRAWSGFFFGMSPLV